MTTKVFVLELDQGTPGLESLYFMGFIDFLECEIVTNPLEALQLREDQATMLADTITKNTRFNVSVCELPEAE